MPPKSQIKDGKILNPDTNRYVGVDTKKGKELLASSSKSKTPAKASPKKKTLASSKSTKTKKQKIIEVLIHPGFGGFGLSDQAVKLYEKKSGKNFDDLDNNNRFSTHDEVKYRSDPILVSVVKKLGKKALRNSWNVLDIISIPAIFKDCFLIDEYDGAEGIDISPHLLVEHLLETTNIKEMTLEESRRFLLKLKRIIDTDTDYDYEKITTIGDRKL